jgi:AcrR family transcriptional regulator
MREAVSAPKRTRRADKAQETHRRIVDSAMRLFLERGYVATTIDAIAEAADVAVETVYARFRTKANLMVAVQDAAVTGGIQPEQRPEVAALAAETDQRRQLQIAAALSRGMLERISPVYALLRDAAAADSALSELLAADIARRCAFQRTLVDRVRAQGPLRESLSADQATDTYSALANPEIYLLLTTHHGWTPAQSQAWLADSLQLLLLPPAPPDAAIP